MAIDTVLTIHTTPDGVNEGPTLSSSLSCFSWSVASAASMAQPSVSLPERLNPDLAISKRLDRISPKLFVMCCSGQMIRKAVLSVTRAGGDKEEFLRLELTDACVSSWTARVSDDAVFEDLSLSYRRVEMFYHDEGPDGTFRGIIKGYWDFAENQGG